VKEGAAMVPVFSTMGDERETHAVRGWVLYDSDCGFCTRLAWRFAGAFERRGYRLVPLQAPWVAELLAMPREKLLKEMRVLTTGGMQVGGADAMIYLARRIWWATPLFAASLLPGMMPLLRRGYRWFAARRHRVSRACAVAPVPLASPIKRLHSKEGGNQI
jgi:predicted DCC family thiol-disulfide oxidoreductase YuxK